MNRRLAAGAVAVVAVMVIAAAGLRSPPSAPDQDATDMAYNCTMVRGDCTLVDVDRRPVNCSYAFVNGERKRSCEMTTEGVSNISLIADGGTYVDIPYRPFDAEIDYYGAPNVHHVGDLAALPSGDVLMSAEDTGRLLRFDDGSFTEAGRIDVVRNGTNGFLGIAIDPAFERNRYIYAFYTYAVQDGAAAMHWPRFWSRVSRFRLTDAGLVNETVLIERIPASIWHNGGGLEFGPDGMLYITTGDAHQGPYAQDVGRLNGKVLRIRANGSIPASNPFPDSPVYSLGHRNPQTLTWTPDGSLYVAEHGFIRYDEINRVRPGANYGWPARMCDEPLFSSQVRYMTNVTGLDYSISAPDARSPFRCYTDWTLAPGAIMSVHNRSDPAHGDLFVAGLRANHLGQMELEDGRITEYSIRFINVNQTQHPMKSRRLRALEYVDGRIYVAGDYDGLAVIRR